MVSYNYWVNSKKYESVVLILVVVEDGLVLRKLMAHQTMPSLNPCCSGRWSRTWLWLQSMLARLLVLILVVVEDGLVHQIGIWRKCTVEVLILVVVEDGLVQAIRNLFVGCTMVLILVVVEDGLVPTL